MRPTLQKVLYYVGNILGVLGALLLVGSILAWMLGPELLTSLYERTKPVLPFFLTGVGLLVLGILLSHGREPGAPAGKVRCGNCAAINDGNAKFCNQCGTAV